MQRYNSGRMLIHGHRQDRSSTLHGCMGAAFANKPLEYYMSALLASVWWIFI